MNDFMEMRNVMNSILRRWWLLVVLTAIGAILGYAISRAQTPVYHASTTVLVGESITSSRVDRVDIQISEALILTYAEIARRQPIMQGVVTTLNLNESWQDLSKRVSVTPIESTQLIEIGVEANSPEQARIVADEIVNQLILLSPASFENPENQLTTSFNREQIINLQERIVAGQQRLSEIDGAINNSVSEVELTALQQEKTALEGLIIEWERNYTQLLTLTEPRRDPTQLSVVEPAHTSNRMIRPRILLNTLLGGAIGMILALGLIFLLDFLDDTYRSLKDFPRPEDVNILGSIRKIRGQKLSDKIIAHLEPHSPITESYRIIRSRLPFKRGDNLARSIMVTSSMPEEGKSVTAANLAVVFAQANYKTVIVDADLRHPVLHKAFNVENEAGLGDMLSSRGMRIEDCIKNTSVNNLQILTSGEPLPDPSSQLGSERMEQILRDLKKIAEIVIFDTPPALVFADAITLSRRIDGIIMVIQAGKSTRSAVNQTLLDLQNANANLLGSIFNQSPKGDTFSVNRVYMQERPQLLSARALGKKEDQFSDLRGSAMPLTLPINEGRGSAELDDKKASIAEMQISDVRDSAMSVMESLEITASDNGTHPTKSDVPYDLEAIQSTNHKEPAQFQDEIDAVASTNDNLETSNLDHEEAIVDEIQLRDPDDSAVHLVDGDLEMSGFESEKALVDETQIHELDDSPVPAVEDLELSSVDSEVHVQETNGQNKRKRNRRSRQNELKSEGVSVGAPNDATEQTNE